MLQRFVKSSLLTLQDFTYLLIAAFRVAFSPPHYWVDLLTQMDIIGVGSLPIVLLTGLFTGAILAAQTYREMQSFGEVTLMGEAVAIAAVRELGPVLTALMVAGRSSSGIASELGSMLVTEQVDAMRALGTDPVRKLVTPRLYATLLTLPLLTILADFTALIGGWMVSSLIAHLTGTQYWTKAYQSLDYHDLTQGLIKPVFFAVVVSSVGCYCGLTTTGGTEGVGRSTTRAVVMASVWILMLDLLITQFLIGIHFS
ncbi:MAG TPA: ABC transporter permease [Terriglobia bacterium]|nr:ABC transporter permease [Terriglobia bacterium]